MRTIKNTLVGLVAGLAIAGAAEVSKHARADSISTISSNVTYGDFNDDGQIDTRVVYTVSNNVSNDVHPYSDIPSWKLGAGEDKSLDSEDIQFDLPSGWTYSVGPTETLFSSNSDIYNLPANTSFEFDLTLFGREASPELVSSVAQNYWGNNLEEYSVDVVPEPTALGLLGIGGLALLAKNRRTKK